METPDVMSVLVTAKGGSQVTLGLLRSGNHRFYAAPQLASAVLGGISRQKVFKLLQRVSRPIKRLATPAEVAMLSQKGHLEVNTQQATLVNQGTAAKMAQLMGCSKVG